MELVRAPLKMIGLPFGFTRCQVASMFTGAACLAGLAATLLCLPLIANAVKNLVDYEFSLAPNTMFTAMWTEVPMTPKLEVFVFNVTNHEAFLAGKDKKIRVEEIGPFFYAAVQSKDIKGYSEDGTEITFKSKTSYNFLPDLSVSDDMATRIIVPNIVLFTGMAKPDVVLHPAFVKRNVVWPVLTSTGRKTPFIDVTVNGFLFGYEDELACLETSAADDQDSSDDFFADDGWGFGGDEETTTTTAAPAAAANKVSSRRVRAKQNYMRPDGRCLVGALERMNATWDETVTMRTGKNNLREKGRIVTVEGVPQLNFWQEGSKCDTLAGDQDLTALPAISPGRRSVDLYMDIMCRSVRMVEEKEDEQSYFGGKIEARMFVADKDNFNFTENDCYKQSSHGLKPGAMVISECQEGAPIAFSFVHFLNADPW
jgi:scavenger receptor class B protein 1